MRKHWTEAVKAENVRLKAEIDALKRRDMLHDFINRVAQSTFTILANTPYRDWPRVAQLAFEHEAERASVPAYFYKEGLPQ